MSADLATRKCRLLAAFLLTFLMSALAAEEDAEHRPLTLTLCADHTMITPGQTFTVGLLLQHQPHHHSYFKFPGIVGVPTNITWTLPVGFQAGDIQWPVPEQVDMRGHGAYGYHKDTLLLVDIAAPKTLTTSSITLSAKVGYMCCSQERCTPGFEDLTLTLQTGREAVPHTTWPKRFAATRKAHAKAFPTWHARLETTEDAFHLHLTAPKGADLPKPKDLYFFATNGWTASDKPHQCQLQDRHYHFTLPKHPFPEAKATRFQGILRHTKGWDDDTTGMLIDLPLK